MEKLYNNSRGVFATFRKDLGYIYLSSQTMRKIEDLCNYITADIYLDVPEKRLIIEPAEDGEFTLNSKICARSAKEYIRDGRHNVDFTEGPEGQAWIVIGFEV